MISFEMIGVIVLMLLAIRELMVDYVWWAICDDWFWNRFDPEWMNVIGALSAIVILVWGGEYLYSHIDIDVKTS